VIASGFVPPSPNKGLSAFDETDTDALFFFGRERDTETIAANLLAARFTVLFGPTGVGKSSVLRAGVVRRARALAPDSVIVVQDAWAGDDPTGNLWRVIAAAAPGVASPDPTTALADRLEEVTASFDGDLYLILDQFEELFTYRHAAVLTAELVEVVTRPELRVNVLVAVRDDALSELDTFTGRIPDVFGNAVPIDRLDRAAGRAAITGPIARYNELAHEPRVSVEPELVEAVLDEVGVGRVVLGGVGRGGTAANVWDGHVEAPYLQLVMQRLWEAERERQSWALRRRTLAELGGAQEIVRAQFDRAVGALTPGERDVAARVFNHLVTPSGSKIGHRVDDLARYADVDEAELQSVLRTLSADRILRPLDDHVEIFHDVLADAVLDWRVRHDAERALELQRIQSERRHRKIVALLGASLVALAAMVAVTVYALTQRSQARNHAAAARAAAQRARARTLDTQAAALIPVLVARRDPELGLLLAAAAARLSPTNEADDILRRALSVSFIRRVLPERDAVGASFDRDGGRAVVATRAGAISVYAGDGRTRLATLRTGSSLNSVALSGDGRLILTTQPNAPATVWDGRTKRSLGTFGRVATVASFSADGSLILTAAGGELRVWRVADGSLVSSLHQPEPIGRASFGPRDDIVITSGSGRIVRVFAIHSRKLLAAVDQGGGVTSATVTQDEGTLVTTGKNQLARSWSLPKHGRPLHEFRGHHGEVTAGAVSPDGRLLLTTSTDSTGRVWNLATGTLVTTLVGHTNRVDGGAFSRDGSSVLTWSGDGTARLWQADSAYVRAILAGPDIPVTGAAFGAGDTVLTTAGDGRVRFWEVPIQPLLRKVAGFPSPIDAAAFSGDGRYATVADAAGVAIIRATDGRRLGLLPAVRVRAIAVSPHGSLAATVGNNSVSMWLVRTQRLLHTFRLPATAVALDGSGTLAIGERNGTIEIQPSNGGFPIVLRSVSARITSLAFSPSGTRVAAGSADGKVTLWNVAERRPLFSRQQHRPGAAVTGVAFDRTGRLLATTGRDAQVFILSAASGTQQEALRGHFATVSGADFSPNGHWLVTAGPGTAGLWDLVSGQRFIFLDGHQGLLLAASFDANGRHISTVGVDGTLRFFDCQVCGGTAELLRLADQRLAETGRKLTPTERQQYLGP
jgi:WD40 repeat protein